MKNTSQYNRMKALARRIPDDNSTTEGNGTNANKDSWATMVDEMVHNRMYSRLSAQMRRQRQEERYDEMRDARRIFRLEIQEQRVAARAARRQRQHIQRQRYEWSSERRRRTRQELIEVAGQMSQIDPFNMYQDANMEDIL